MNDLTSLLFQLRQTSNKSTPIDANRGDRGGGLKVNPPPIYFFPYLPPKIFDQPHVHCLGHLHSTIQQSPPSYLKDYNTCISASLEFPTVFNFLSK